ncbi:MAG: TonB-dependent receptor [Bacteroidales bacterium]|nr:TonB-dependent receptor [Bacteroidales bacterium]
MSLNEVVVTGTKTFKRKTESPVIVNVLEGKTLGLIQASTLSEGLCFQPGLRVETDCQTCNYSQLRMNGLGGSYSQILINGRPIFSPLTGLYGMEQIPANMIDRIEVVRGGGSALYGSSAIGGTVNILTKIPDQNTYEVSVNHAVIDGVANDNQVNANMNVLSPQRNAGMSFFATRRERDYFDVNGDNYSEMPMLKNNSFGVTSFLKPTPNQKLEFSFSSMYEYRYGGEMTDKAAHEAEQSEERTHNVIMGSVDYEIDLNNDKTSFITYLAGQNTKRKHYTGIIPETGDSSAYIAHFMNPPYGDTDNSTFQAGIQFNHKIENFLSGTNTITAGAEYLYDDVLDVIEAYNYKIDQTTYTTGSFLQSDWEIMKGLTLLSGLRADKHNLVSKVVVNPRFSLLYKLYNNTQFRASWSTGFRAPQAFDTDMHIAFAGGGVSRVRLAENLKEERSTSYSLSVNHDRATEKYIWGFTLEGFYTVLENAFKLEEAGEDNFGLIFEKRNASGSLVQGITFELRGNYSKKVQVETGLTLQSSYFENPVAYSESLEPVKKYLRTPDRYGYYTVTITPGERFNASLSGVYTGSMDILHVAGSPENPDTDRIITTGSFFENNFKLSYLFRFEKLHNGLEVFWRG